MAKSGYNIRTKQKKPGVQVITSCHAKRSRSNSEKSYREPGVRVVPNEGEELYREPGTTIKFSKTAWLSVLSLLIVVSCDDILEEPDISNQEIQILAPTDGSVIGTNETSFNWVALQDAGAYEVQIAHPTFENATQILLDSIIEPDTLGVLRTRIDMSLLNGAYQWRVRGFNSGFSTPYTLSNFSINGDENADLVPPNTPILVSPPDGSAQDETEVAFSWTREDVNGSPERDSIYIYQDETLQTLETKGLGANKTFTTILSSNTFYWFVKAFDGAGNESEVSEVFEFTIN